MRTLLLAMLALLALAPLAAAQETNETKDENATRPHDAAWAEDCPPDMMCAYNEPQPYGPEDCIECSGPAPSDGGTAPGRVGPDDCIDCMPAPQPDDGSTCMDGQQEGEACDDRVQYLDGRGPADCEYCRGGDGADAEPISAPATDADAESAGADAKNAVPAAGLGVIVAAFGLAVVLVARKL